MEKYEMRGLPCNINTDDKLWCVVGEYSNGSGGGVLEWCYDEQDARYVLGLMLNDKRYRNLKAVKYIAN